MLEIILLIVVVCGMAKIASADGQSSIVWGGITLGMGVLAIAFVPIVFLRILGAGIVAFALLIAYKVITKK